VVERPNRLRVAIDTAVELRVDQLRVRHREVRVRAVRSTFVVRTGREDLVLRPLVLAEEPAHVAEPESARELPERLLPEEETRGGILRRGRGQRRHRGWLQTA